MGLCWDYYHFGKKLQSDDSREVNFENGHYFKYQAQVNYNSEDLWYFPTKGSRFMAGYAYITDNFARLNGKAGVSDVSASWRKSVALSKSFALQAMVYGRLLFGTDIPNVYGNLIGGDYFGHYVEQQLPMTGLGHVEYAERHFVGVQMQAQQRFGKSHYFLFRMSVAQHSADLEDILKTKSLIGTQLAYYYDTVFGPLGATIGYSNRTKTPYLYINLGYVF